MPRPRSSAAAELLHAARGIRAWRRDRPRRPLSAELWRRAAELARRHGVHATAKALRLDYYAVRRRAESPPPASGAFVELAPAPAAAPCVVELRDDRGASMHVRLAGAEAGALVEALARRFWGRDR